jgi:SAM-dependent methyltransferase
LEGGVSLDSVEYYNIHAVDYFEETVGLDMHNALDEFIEELPEGASILDLGCGSGRDSLYLIEHGFDVTAMDASEEMCDLASIHIGQEVLRLSFSELDFQEVFDGIWACESLLHLPGNEIEDILDKIVTGMKPGGILFMSFGYGYYEGLREGLFFKDYRTKMLKELIGKFDDLEITEIKKYSDVRSDKENTWIQVYVRKKIKADSEN